MSHECYACGEPAYFRTTQTPRDEPGTSAWACPWHKRKLVRRQPPPRRRRVILLWR